MPRHRIAFYFADESPEDCQTWQGWLAAAPACVRDAATMGERRPFLELAAPFPHRNHDHTLRDAEDQGLELVHVLLAELAAIARSRGRTIRLLLSAQPCGLVEPTGPDATITAKLEAWERLVAAHLPEPPEWEREGWVSIWIGMLPADDFKSLLAETYGTERPISQLARDLGLHFMTTIFWRASITRSRDWRAMRSRSSRLPRASSRFCPTHSPPS